MGKKGAYFEMGTGKTCTAISVIENLRYEKTSNIKQALVIARGTGLLKNFINELLFKCTDGRYIPAHYDKLTDTERVYRIKKETNKFYVFYTFETFARYVSKQTDAGLLKQYSNTVVVIDEIHNIREKDSQNAKKARKPKDAKKAFIDILFRDPLYIYKQFHRFLHVIKQSKILLMSGTVMKDDPSEFASVMNLILPLDKQFPVDRDFMNIYFDLTVKQPIMRPEMRDDFTNKIRGRVSYLKAMITDVKKVFVGSSTGGLRHFKVAVDHMSDFQSGHYTAAYRNDDNHIFNRSRQATLFVFPDGTYGKAGFDQKRYMTKTTTKSYVATPKQRHKHVYTLGPDLLSAIGFGDVNSKLLNLAKYSSKYASTIKVILKTMPTKALVYCEFVNGGGAILFSKILELFGFSIATGNDQTPAPRYAILTTQTTTHQKSQLIINRFNEPDNVDGKYIAVIIGSRVVSEGFTLNDIRQEFILTPHWEPFIFLSVSYFVLKMI